MKLVKNINTKKRTIIIAVSAIILLVGVFFAAAYLLKLGPFQTVVDPNSQRQETESESTKNDNPITKNESTADVNQGKDSSQVPVSTSLVATITDLNQEENTIKFSANITNAKNQGTCVVTFSNENDRPIVKEFDAAQKDNSALCVSTFSALEFSYLGEWDVSLRYYSGSEQAVAQGKITIN